jgi:hypothetical protein
VNNNKSANAPRLAAIFGFEQDCSNVHMVDVHTDSLERARIAHAAPPRAVPTAWPNLHQ